MLETNRNNVIGRNTNWKIKPSGVFAVKNPLVDTNIADIVQKYRNSLVKILLFIIDFELL